MVNRMHPLALSSSFFILGPRGAGKSTLIRHRYLKKNCLYIDLLDLKQEDRYRVHPEALKQQVAGQSDLKWVIIDEVQKLPLMLDTVHQLIEETKVKFVLSGSSARKLKRGGANLLAGRAFVFHLYPLSFFELNNRLTLKQVLQWGALPRMLSLKSNQDKIEYLRSYALTYLKEEIQMEQVIRKLNPFRAFLEVAAQMNGRIVNYSKIARGIGVDTTTVQNYYSILEDTLIGFPLPAYHTSVRKSQSLASKFYLFDTGVCRALKRTLSVPLVSGTYDFGDTFEHFIILECMKLAEYLRKEWRFYYLLTKDGVEIDLIIEQPGKKTFCVEIKSSSLVTEDDVRSLSRIGKDMPGKARLYCLSRDPQKKKILNVHCRHWREGLREIFSF